MIWRFVIFYGSFFSIGQTEALNDITLFDTSEDGEITFEEFRDGLRRLGPQASKWVSEKLTVIEARRRNKARNSTSAPASLDDTKDKEDEEEQATKTKSLVKSKTSLQKMNELNKLIHKTFKRLDKNHDGVLSKNELKRALKKVRVHASIVP